MRLSIIIPSYKDPYLTKTIEDILKNSELGNSLEVIAVFDGYWPDFKLVEDPRVRYVHRGSNGGMRRSINTGMNIARGDFVGRLDEHCCFAKGFDKVLTDECKENWILTPRRYYLDPVKWEVIKDKGFVDYEDLTIQQVSEGVRKFAGRPNHEKTKARKDIMVDKKTAMQGSFWIMPRKWWKKHIGELQTDGYGPLIQDSVEVSMKTWQAGGELMLTKNTWYSHKHRSFSRTHSNGTIENPSKDNDGYAYSLKQWEQYYKDVLLPKWKNEEN